MLEKHYSGHNSHEFWNEINTAPDMGIDLYLLGCVLQDIEGRILQLLREGGMSKSRDSEKITDVLSLSTRTENALRYANVNTIGELLKHKGSELIKYKNLGRMSLIEIVKELDRKKIRNIELI